MRASQGVIDNNAPRRGRQIDWLFSIYTPRYGTAPLAKALQIPLQSYNGYLYFYFSERFISVQTF
jgi:hypothetical protein